MFQTDFHLFFFLNPFFSFSNDVTGINPKYEFQEVTSAKNSDIVSQGAVI